MNKEEVRDKLEQIINSIGNFGLAVAKDSNFFSEKIFDSMEAIDYMIRIDEEFGIEMNMEIMEEYKLGKISDMTNYISDIINK